MATTTPQHFTKEQTPNLSTFNFTELDVDVFNDTNTTSGSYVPYSSRPETYIVPILFALIFVVGVVGNGALVALFARNKQLRNVPNTFIISLAIGDLLVLFFTVPFVSTIYTIDSWPYGEFECKFSEFIRNTSVGVTVFTLTALAADRYMAIVSPVRKAVGSAGASTVRIAVAIWILSIILAAPDAATATVLVVNISEGKSISVCYLFTTDTPPWYPRFNVLAKALVYYALPLVIIGSFYMQTSRHLLSSAAQMPGEVSIFHRQIQTRRKVAKVVLCFVMIFAVCFLPSHVFLLWFYFDENSQQKYNDFWHSVRIVGFCLNFLNSCINPIALYCVSGTFRKHYNHCLFRCCLPHPIRLNSDLHRAPGSASLRSHTPIGSRYRSTLRTEATTFNSLLGPGA